MSVNKNLSIEDVILSKEYEESHHGEEVCKACGDEGVEGGCPLCGKLPVLGASVVKEKATSDVLDNLKIPKFYLNNRWDREILLDSHEGESDDEAFIAFADQLKKLHDGLKNGLMLRNSAIVTAPIGYSKTTWAMSCILEAFEHGYKVAPLIDTNQMQRLVTLASERPSEDWRHRVYGCTYKGYIESDILFIICVRGNDYTFAHEVIVNISDIRARDSKPTIFLSERTTRELCSFDKKNKTLETLLNTKGNVDPFRYLTEVSYRPNKGVIIDEID